MTNSLTYDEIKLLEAAEDNLHWEVRRLLEETKVNIDIQDLQGRTPLMHSVINGNLMVYKLLSDKGADSTIKDINGKTVHEILKEKSRTWAEFVAAASTPEVEEEAYRKPQKPEWKKLIITNCNGAQSFVIRTADNELIMVNITDQTYRSVGKPCSLEEMQKYQFYAIPEYEEPNYSNQT